MIIALQLTVHLNSVNNNGLTCRCTRLDSRHDYSQGHDYIISRNDNNDSTDWVISELFKSGKLEGNIVKNCLHI